MPRTVCAHSAPISIGEGANGLPSQIPRGLRLFTEFDSQGAVPPGLVLPHRFFHCVLSR